MTDNDAQPATTTPAPTFAQLLASLTATHGQPAALELLGITHNEFGYSGRLRWYFQNYPTVAALVAAADKRTIAEAAWIAEAEALAAAIAALARAQMRNMQALANADHAHVSAETQATFAQPYTGVRSSANHTQP